MRGGPCTTATARLAQPLPYWANRGVDGQRVQLGDGTSLGVGGRLSVSATCDTSLEPLPMPPGVGEHAELVRARRQARLVAYRFCDGKRLAVPVRGFIRSTAGR